MTWTRFSARIMARDVANLLDRDTVAAHYRLCGAPTFMGAPVADAIKGDGVMRARR